MARHSCADCGHDYGRMPWVDEACPECGSLTRHFDPGVSQGPPLPRRSRWRKLRSELRILRRDGVRRYVRGLLSLRRFNRSVARMG